MQTKLFSIWLVLFLALFVSMPQGFSQATRRLKGSVKDRDHNPVEFATVSLFKINDSSTALQSTLTDSLGQFSMSNILPGNYMVKIQYTSFLSLQKMISVEDPGSELNVGTFLLDRSVTELQTVSVTARKKSFQRTEGGFIFNAASNLTQEGGTATDILRNTPTVVVDAEGNISIRGKVPLILINGRNSGIAGTDQIPAASVESIEIISNPSAQYDAESEGGIINIRLKKNTSRGFNGALAIGSGFGTRARFNSSGLINYRNELWNFSLAYDNRFAGRTRKVNGDRINFASTDERFLIQRRFDERKERLQNLKINMEYYSRKNEQISLEAIGNLNGEDNDESLTNQILTELKTFSSRYTPRSLEYRKARVGEVALDYTKKFSDPRQRLSAGVNTAFNREKENTDIRSQSLSESNQPVDDAFLQKTNNYQQTNISNIRFDYSHPVNSKSVIHLGYKSTLRFLHADYQWLDRINGSYIPNLAASSLFNYREQIHAAYLQYITQIGDITEPRWKYDVGIRAEQVWNDGKLKTNNLTFRNNYLKFFPSAGLTFNLNPKEWLKLSYSRRINRPGLGQLNPFTDITDSLNQRAGNPYLRPELVHSVEAAYNKELEKISLISMLFYRFASDAIRPFTELRPDGVAFTKPVNIGHAISYGLENIIIAKLFQFYDVNLSFSFFRQDLKGEVQNELLANQVFSWYGKLINNFVPWSGGKLQITGVYNSPVATPQGERIAIYNVDLGLQQKLGRGNGRLGLIVTDIFNTQKNGFITNGNNFTFSRIFKVDTRAILLTFGWTFGTSFKEKLMENQFLNE